MGTSARLFLLGDVNFLINGDQNGFKIKEQEDKVELIKEISVNPFVTRTILDDFVGTPWFEKRSFKLRSANTRYNRQMEGANKNNLLDSGLVSSHPIKFNIMM